MLIICISFVMAIIFIAVGIYFLSSKFLDKLNEASSVKSEEAFRKNKFRAKGCGLVSLGVGFLTFVWALIIISFPMILNALALVYMLFILAAVIALMIIMK